MEWKDKLDLAYVGGEADAATHWRQKMGSLIGTFKRQQRASRTVGIRRIVCGFDMDDLEDLYAVVVL